MFTAVDSSVLIDVLSDDPAYAASSKIALKTASSLGSLIACPVVWTELRSVFDDATVMENALTSAAIAFDPFDRQSALVAGELWRDYRRNGGTRVRVVADFLIGAHAYVRGGRLLTRDRGFYRQYFSNLTIVEP